MKNIAIAILTLLLLAWGGTEAQAQNIVVKSFRLAEQDLTANLEGTTVIDQNGLKCALIKVETTQTGFTFDVGMLGVRKVEQKVGEVWVYVPEGVKRISIMHPQLGVLRDHDLGQTLRRAKTYILQLVTGEVQTIVRQTRTSQYVVFQLTPANAVVELDGEMLATADGTATKYVPFGTYDYTVKAPDYLPEVGKVTVNDPKNKVVKQVQLRPNFSSVTLTVDNNAEIWVNGQKKGNGTWTGNLGAGTYDLEARLPNHRPSQRQHVFEVTAQPQSLRLDAPTPILGEANINSTPAMADVSIDGKAAGQTPILVSELLVGQHTIRITKKGYDDYSATLTVQEGQTADLAATLKRQTTPAPAVNNAGGTPLASGAQAFTVKGVTFYMVPVEGGTFTMGATREQGRDADSDEKPTHQVTLSNYYMGETEVTQALWEAVMGNNPSYFKGSNKPVEKVSWNDCQTFIQKLNQLTGRQFRLPTEAEWEYAARGGKKSRGYKYSGSNDIGSVAWYDDNSGNKTHDVKTKQPNKLGLYDMSGNVWEWCQDWYGSYSSSAQTNPTGASSGAGRVSRGGSLNYFARYCRVSNRIYNAPSFQFSNLGLRLVL